MPNSSSVLTRLASEYLGGGCVKCCSPEMSLTVSTSFSLSDGSLASSSLEASSESSRYTDMKPGNVRTCPLARKIALFFPTTRSTLVVSNLAGVI